MTREENIQYLEARLRDNPKSIHFARLADYYLKQGRIDEAIELCLEGINHHPSYVTGNFILAKAYLAKGEREKAEAEYKKVLTHDQQYLAAHRELGDLMAKTGWENKAIMHYKTILRIDPLDEETRQMLRSVSGEGRIATPTVEKQKIEETPSPGAKEVPSIEGKPEEDWSKELEDVFSTEKTEHADEATTPPHDGTSESPTVEIPELEEKTEDVEESITLDIPQDTVEKETPEETSPPAVETQLIGDEPVFEPMEGQTAEDTETPVPQKEPEPEAKPGEKEFSFDIADVATEMEEKEEKQEDLSEDTLLDVGEIPPETPTEETPLAPETMPDIESEKEVPRETPSEEDTTETETPLTATEPESTDEDREPETGAPSEEKREAKIVSPTLGEIYAAQGQYAKAIKIYETLVKNNPKDESRYREKIEALQKKLDDSASI
jgi:tetratricopeptide (TPR) repeat protein